MQVATDLTMFMGIQAEKNKRNSNIPNCARSVVVLFTSANRTLKALESARSLANTLCLPIVVLATPVVPYPLELEEPQVPFNFKIRNFAETANQYPEDISVVAYNCRDRMQSLKQVLPTDSPVLVGIRKRWWPTSDERLARDLERAGYSVTVVETE
jgi:hypothetical protein